MPGGAAAATAEETPVPKEGNKNEKGQKSRPARGGGSKPPTGSGDRDVSPSTTSTGSWIKLRTSNRRSIQEWMKIDEKDPNLDWKRARAADEGDERVLGAPCWGDHDTLNPCARNANQYQVQYKCVKCRLVMLYVPKRGATGEYRKAGPLGKTVGRIDIQQITKERPPKKEHSRATSKDKDPPAPPVPEWSESEDSFQKEGTSDEEEETPYIDTGKKRATTPGNPQGAAGSHAPGVQAVVNDLMRDSAKRPAAAPSRRRTPKTSPQGGGPEDV